MHTTKIEIFEKKGKSYLKFIFNGRLESRDADNAISKWKEIFFQNTDKKFIIIWDCLRMQGYDHETRVKWQSTLGETKDQIDYIWIITQSKMLKMGAQVMTLLTDIKLKVVDREGQIED